MRDRVGKSLRLEEWARRDSFLHRRDARGKILSVLLFLVAVSSTPPSSPAAFIPIAILLACGLIVSGVPVLEILARASVIIPFPLFFGFVSWLENGNAMFAVALVVRSYVSALAVLLLMGVTPLPELLRGQVHLLGIDLGSYRLFLIAVVIVVTLALTWLIERTRFGAAIRASVDNQQAAAGLGINVYRVFSLTFALGSGLAGLGGGLGIDVLGLDPTFPLKYMVYFLLIVAVGGAGTIKGPLIAAVLLGVFDVAGKYYVPQIGSFIIYVVMVIMLLVFPRGLVGRRV